MHWFWRAAIAVVITILVYVGLCFGLDRFLYSVILVSNRVHSTIFYSLQFLNAIVAISVYGILTYRYGPRPIDPETRCRKCGYILPGMSKPRLFGNWVEAIGLTRSTPKFTPFGWIIRALLALALGVLITGVVAWAMTIIPSTAFDFGWEKTGWYTNTQDERIDVHFKVIQGQDFYSIGDGASHERMCKVMRERPNVSYQLTEHQHNKFGFPFHSMDYQSTSVFMRLLGKGVQGDCEFENLIEFHPKQLGLPWPWQAPGGGRYRFPLGILWPGFIADAFFFAVVSFIMLCCPRIILRRIRHQRGLCLNCGYNLTGNVSGVCPECGEKI